VARCSATVGSLVLVGFLGGCGDDTAGSASGAGGADLGVRDMPTGGSGSGGRADPGGDGGESAGGSGAPGGNGAGGQTGGERPPAGGDLAKPDQGSLPPGEDATPPGPPEGDGAVVPPPASDGSVPPPVVDGGGEPPPPPPPPPAGDPALDGPAGVHAADTQIELPGGILPRRVDLLIRRPAEPAGAPYPLVVLSHGFQASGSDYASYADRLATHGFVVVAPTYDGGLVSRTHVELADDVVAVVDWALAQNEAMGSDLFHWIDGEHIGAAGHSRGGKQSFFAALIDPRIDAVFGLDPVDSGPPFAFDPNAFPSLAPERIGELTIPTAVLGSERGPEGAVACAPAEDNWDDYYAVAPSPAFAWLVAGSGHMDFLDECGLTCLACTAGDDPAFTRDFSRTTMVAFFRFFLLGEADYRPWLDGDAARLDPRVEVQSR
jgi:predicted dienelactone hydrolase